VKGFLNGRKARMLIVSGASGNFIIEQFLSSGRETLNGMISIMEPKIVKLANGSTKTNLKLSSILIQSKMNNNIQLFKQKRRGK